MAEVGISIDNNNRSGLVGILLQDIERHCAGTSLKVILPLNVPELLSFDISGFTFPIYVIYNKTRNGFGENHNAALFLEKIGYFCVMILLYLCKTSDSRI